jgi:replication initiation and membrane attachment protein DnaB
MPELHAQCWQLIEIQQISPKQCLSEELINVIMAFIIIRCSNKLRILNLITHFECNSAEDLGYTSFDLDTIKILIRRMELNENQTVQFNGTLYKM